MDQVKVFLAVLKKHHFWVLCGVSVLVAMGVWWSATAGLADKIDERINELEGINSNVKNISSGGSHPNEKCITEIEKRHGGLTGNVYRTWEKQYMAQKERNKWPVELGEDVRTYIELLDPDAEIPDYYRDTYMYFIRNHFPELGKIVDVRLPAMRDENGEIVLDDEGKPVKIDPFANARGGSRTMGSSMMGEYSGADEEGMMGSGMMGSGMMGSGSGYTAATRAGGDNLVGIVEWSQANQSRIRDRLYWATRPSTIEVRLAQEDLWIYKALLRIIAKTNESATSYYNAPIKRIDALEIGQMAGMSFARSRGRATGGGMYGSGGMMGSGGSMMMGSGMADPMMMSGSYDMEQDMEGGAEGSYGAAMMGGGPTGSGAPSAAAIADSLKDRLINLRYVDQNGIPLAASDPEPFAEFKMMPIRMLLFIDQRRVSRLLVNCANSPMPVEVRQVTLNAGAGGSLNLGRPGAGGPGAGMMGGPMGGYGPYGSGEEEDMYSGMGGPTGSSAMTRSSGKQQSYDIPVEVLGIIYIFNRPDKEKLGTGAGTAPLEDSAPAEPAQLPPTEPAQTPPAEPAAPGATPPAGPAATPAAGPAATPPAGPAATPPAGPAPATTPPAGPAPATTPPAATPPATPAAPGAANP